MNFIVKQIYAGSPAVWPDILKFYPFGLIFSFLNVQAELEGTASSSLADERVEESSLGGCQETPIPVSALAPNYCVTVRTATYLSSQFCNQPLKEYLPPQPVGTWVSWGRKGSRHGRKNTFPQSSVKCLSGSLPWMHWGLRTGSEDTVPPRWSGALLCLSLPSSSPALRGVGSFDSLGVRGETVAV